MCKHMIHGLFPNSFYIHMISVQLNMLNRLEVLLYSGIKGMMKSVKRVALQMSMVNIGL